ncbi:MAG: hypothetical protein FWB86_02670 [Treponema sp.]|nr:hypothetical protein [Treponema sp.]MCL2251769.1 hypothetical protein [Treponema sp.]
MKKLILILLAFLAVFTYIRVFTNAEAEENSNIMQSSLETQKAAAEIILPKD